jgi:nanoRNase/pAp phosphatase (c-di-AMP/oligoRNAs hydrolase)
LRRHHTQVAQQSLSLCLVIIIIIVCTNTHAKIQEMATAELEKRIGALELGATYDATKTAVQKVEAECLMKLREIRAALVAEVASGGGVSSAAATGKAGAAAAELQQLQTENDELKRKMAKLEYRIEHIVTSMEMLYGKLKDACVDTRASF